MGSETPGVFYERMFSEDGRQESDVTDVVSQLREDKYLQNFL